eukprot:CAMPEP_0178384710 /NCGR_PEP_ID=MMETSP0689_2-20121128/7656_1 /TAXON_ID=160604 /ORGANISM="Amphidinium massartii, Strain CS-259" /LENGTH=701 /DNA_ID=CAMNT_0020004967 /DNA_START=72 /DNA_END=2173 /DNA_ORIENTATION=+
MGNVPIGTRTTCCGKVCTKVIDPDGDVLDDLRACDPAGTVFHETLEDLNEVDRLLILFCASSNFVAVRWLCALGASPDACDINGTTCLHTACRSGALHIVQDLIDQGLALDATDVAGWTPLHVAMFMGRRAVSVLLMQQGAELKVENSKGQTPVDVCNDASLREAASACASHRQRKAGEPWQLNSDFDIAEDTQVTNALRFEPFFVPRASFLKEPQLNNSYQQLGVQIFNATPGQGLAFLVASGGVRDYPIELSAFLMEHSINIAQVGELLGEDFSISQTLRLEFINSIRLTHTGVVSCLAKVFKMIRIPSDMQKIDRLVEGVAQIWWRQHERMQAKPHQNQQVREVDLDGEFEGLRLMQNLSGHHMLHQLMFSTIMLHWSLYAPLPPSQRISSQRWVDMNAGIQGPKGSTAASLQQVMTQIYKVVSKFFIPHLQIWSSKENGQGASKGMMMRNPASAKADEAEIEGWARLADRGLPQVTGGTGTVTYRHIRNIHSETTSNGVKLASPATSRDVDLGIIPTPDGLGAPASVAYKQAPPAWRGPGKGLSPMEPGERAAPGGERVWLSVHHALMFFAQKPSTWAPYAFLQLKPLVIRHVDTATCTLTLAAPDASMLGVNKSVASEAMHSGLPPPMMETSQARVQLVFLLPDGRWQVVEITRLEVQFIDQATLEKWVTICRKHCTGGQASDVANSETTGAGDQT